MNRQRRLCSLMRRLTTAGFVAGFLVASLAQSVAGAALPQASPSPGAVVALRGTPHLWVADAQGVFHWAGDTRALAGRVVDWDSRRETGLDEVQGLRRGDPWLTAGLVRLGEPIYFAKWEADAARPTLLHIQSIDDVELFGIGPSNYGTYVLDQPAWEQRFGFPTTQLARGQLAPATGGGAAPAVRPPAPQGTPAPPVPLGVAADLGDGWQLTVVAVDADAEATVRAHNLTNGPPAPGGQFVLVRLAVTRTSTSPDRFLAGLRLRARGPGGIIYPAAGLPCGVIPDALYPSNSDAFPGGTLVGAVCFEVASAEAEALVMEDDPAAAGASPPVDAVRRTTFALTP